MTLGHVGQFDAIHCDSTTHKVLSNYILMLDFFLSFTVYGASKFTCLILLILIFLVSGVFCVFWNLFLFLSSFSAILLRDVIGSKNERFTKRLITKACVQCGYCLYESWLLFQNAPNWGLLSHLGWSYLLCSGEVGPTEIWNKASIRCILELYSTFVQTIVRVTTFLNLTKIIPILMFTVVPVPP